ncbi:hypothetical protein SAMN05444409_2446 [Epilithonimonas zeae]|uniref:Uncharacterized protein n=1 Tax=Epilithonimonas zeae TaxID=1416779 RepID=A0A1N6HG61_9FLAO|nr:hypothetical protein SAMN05444409_2446 [Epilithonimonas zeae]
MYSDEFFRVKVLELFLLKLKSLISTKVSTEAKSFLFFPLLINIPTKYKLIFLLSNKYCL